MVAICKPISYLVRMTLGSRIQQACDAKAISPAELARRIGKHRQYINAILKAGRSGDTMLRAIAEALEVPVEWLTTGHDAVAPVWARRQESASEREKRLQGVIEQMGDDVNRLKAELQMTKQQLEGARAELDVVRKRLSEGQ